MNGTGLFSGLYNSFIERDLVYIVGGGILLASLDWSFSDQFGDHAELVATSLAHFVAFVAVSYLVGLLLQAGFSFFGFCNDRFLTGNCRQISDSAIH